MRKFARRDVHRRRAQLVSRGMSFGSRCAVAPRPERRKCPIFDSPRRTAIRVFRFSCPFGAHRRDTYVDELYSAAPACGATLIGAVFPRSYLDPNRAVDDLDAALIDGTWPSPLAPSRRTQTGLGLVRRVAGTGVPIYDRKLGVGEVLARLERCHTPYHRVLDDACRHAHSKFGSVWHLNCHSMPSHRSGKKGGHCADFVLGDRDGTTCASEFTEFVAQALRRRGYTVRINEVYKGVEIVKRQGHPAQRRPACRSKSIARSTWIRRRREEPGL